MSGCNELQHDDAEAGRGGRGKGLQYLLAFSPTRILPLGVKATTEGTTLPLSLSGMITGAPSFTT